ncbi:MAG: hypothetical protein FJW39_00870 [Acidobacteria bacterium]|nr:hypothetical protein [Acidobacteriota bacterium]
MKNVDFGLAKRTPLTERMTFEIRAEFYNVSNHPWFSEMDGQATRVDSARFGWFEQRQRNEPRVVALAGKLSW